MMKMLFIKIVFGFYSICAIFVNGSPAIKDWELVRGLRNSPKKKESRNVVPEFEDTEDEIIAKVGETVRMPCSVKNLGENVVSWIRQKSLLILTSGLMTFAGDSRFQVDHSDDSNEWCLQLTDVHLTDAGVYECQINTEPKLKRAVHLIVTSGNGDINFYSDDEVDASGNIPPNFQLATQAFGEGVIAFYIPGGASPGTRDLRSRSRVYLVITRVECPPDAQNMVSLVGPTEKFVQLGSTITLTCHVKLNGSSNDTIQWSSKYRKPIQWFHFADLISIRAERGGVSIETTKLSSSIVSNLIITSATYQDSGIYSCKPLKGQSAKVIVTILQNEEMEAVKPENYLQSNNATKDDIIVRWKKLFLLYALLLFIRFPT